MDREKLKFENLFYLQSEGKKRGRASKAAAEDQEHSCPNSLTPAQEPVKTETTDDTAKVSECNRKYEKWIFSSILDTT